MTMISTSPGDSPAVTLNSLVQATDGSGSSERLIPMPVLDTASEELLTVPDVARLLRVAESTVRKWAASGRIPFVELPGGEYRIPRTELIRGLRGNVDIERVLARVEVRLAATSEEDISSEVRAVRAERARAHR